MKRFVIAVLIIGFVAGLGLLIYRNLSMRTENFDNATLIHVDYSNASRLVSGVYTNPTFGFAINLPESLKVTDFDDGGGHTTLIQGAVAEVEDFSMQIFISPFDEDIDLTVARIRADIPDLKMEEPVEIKTDGVATVTFFSNDLGEKYREVWFVHGLQLYQILARAERDQVTSDIMNTWQWTK